MSTQAGVSRRVSTGTLGKPVTTPTYTSRKTHHDEYVYTEDKGNRDDGVALNIERVIDDVK